MRASSDLSKLYQAIQYRIARIRKLYATSITPTGGMISRSPLGAATIELDNVLVCGLREFTVSSFFRSKTMSGVRITSSTSFSGESELSAFMLSVINPVRFASLKQPPTVSRKIEPTIRDPKDTEKIFLSANVSNLSSLQTALGLNLGVFSHISTVRNFYAHRNENTARKATRKAYELGAGSNLHPDELVCAKLPGRPVTVFDDWADELSIFFEELMK